MIKKLFLFSLCIAGISACNSTQTESAKTQNIIDTAIENRTSIKPIIHIESMYPKEAFEAGIQGYCKASFDLSKESGLSKPTNIIILECDPVGTFESVCIDSISRWRFKSVESLNSTESTDGLITTCKFELSGV